jgi:outer membrane receptor protein involved in Fe transport
MNHTLKKTVRFGLPALFAVSAALAQPSTGTTENKNDEPKTLEKFEVTGSRIKRLDFETPAPVETYTTQDMESKGYVNIGEFMQSLPFNSGTANSIFQTSSFQRGAATANIRGLGAQRFLTLVDGRRPAPYALVSPNAGTRQVFDFNSLPAAAIESFEFLKDGASALYGSDAITGVLNVKLKKNYSGLATTLYYGNTFQGTGGDTGVTQLSVVAGAGAKKTRIMTAIDLKTANSNFLHDYGVNSTDYSYLGANKGSNQNSTAAFPASISLTRTQAAAFGLPFPNVASTVSSWTYVSPNGTPIANPAISSFVPAPANPDSPNSVLAGNANRYNFAETYQIFPAYDYISNFTSIEHEFSDTLKAFATLTYSKNSSYYAFTPVPITFSTEGLVLPATNPYNPFGVALSSLTTRATFIPVRKFDTDSTSSSFIAGLRGSYLNRFDWETAVNSGFSNVSSVSRNAIRASTLQSYLNGTTKANAFNPFGPSDPSVIAGLTTVSPSNSRAEVLSWDANVSGRLFDLPAGSAGVAAGLEFRNERQLVDPDTAAYIGSGGGAPLLGERRVASQYVEIAMPVYKTKQLGSAELQVAARHETYSDFGSTTKPKVAGKITLPENKFVNLIVRGSFSESFQAPALGLLYASQTVAFSSGLLQDPLRPQDPPVQMRIVQGGNPNLLPETGKTKYVGGVLEFPKVRNLSLSVDFFDMRINQYIVTPSSTYLLTAAGRAQFPNAIVRDNTLSNPGPILRLEAVPSNNPLAYQIYRGLDYGLRYSLRNTRLGSFAFNATATQIIKRGTDSGLGGGFYNNAGYYFDPRWKGSFSTAWNYKQYGASLTADYTHHWFNDGYTVTGWGENPLTILGAQLRYAGFFGTNLQVGCSNLLNTRPPVNGREVLGMSTVVSPTATLGRFVYVRVRKEF